MILKPLASQDTARGALPTLFAATSPAAIPGGYYGPSGNLAEVPAAFPLPAEMYILRMYLNWEQSIHHENRFYCTVFADSFSCDLSCNVREQPCAGAGRSLRCGQGLCRQGFARRPV